MQFNILQLFCRFNGLLTFIKSENTNKSDTMAVVADVPECSNLGLEILKMGGNAMDAAIASAICVGTINSFSSGLGGGGFLMVKKPGNVLEVETVDFREVTPAKVRTQNYTGRKDVAKKGGFAVAVPGEVKGLHYAHKKYGKLSWETIFNKNAEIARSFKVSIQLEKRLVKLKKHIFADPGLRETFTRDGKLLKEGDIVYRLNYAKTLEILAKNPEDFYRGTIAKAMIESITENGGVMTMDDLKNYKIKTPEPKKGTYKDATVFTTNLPTAGPLIIEAMNMLEIFDLKEIQEIGQKYGIFPEYHLLNEIFKFMSARRSDLGDEDYTPNVEQIVEQLISKKYADDMTKAIKFDRALKIEEYGYEKPFVEDHGTTHLNTVDKNGMIVLLTSTINLEFGAKFMDPQTGIIFNNEIDDFYIPSVRNAFDLPVSKANIIVPGKRPFSSASPLLIIRKDETIALGASGGTRIPTSILNAFFHLQLGRNMQQAISQSRIHHQTMPHVTYIEGTLDPQIKSYLELMGNVVQVSSLNSIFTAVQGLRIIKKGDQTIIEAESDPRKGGKAAKG
ncbi:Gamma-glutamyltransferase [Pseudoloma neurophilia]|uniref:Glutathione hydrolase n=1 Tax=Pseudoloma neurophilia TaxID=146866 RepID=A0A0R0LZU9_9MICR|nr:Gamma-glutamyltransferase [Pseudoloma neurophilia]